MSKLTESAIRRLVRSVITEASFTGRRKVPGSYGTKADRDFNVWSAELARAYGPSYLNFSSDFAERFPGHEGWSAELARAYGPGYLNSSSDLRGMESSAYKSMRVPKRFGASEPDMYGAYDYWSEELAAAYGDGYLNFSSDFAERFPGHEGWSEELAAAYGPGYLNMSGDLRAADTQRRGQRGYRTGNMYRSGDF